MAGKRGRPKKKKSTSKSPPPVVVKETLQQHKPTKDSLITRRSQSGRFISRANLEKQRLESILKENSINVNSDNINDNVLLLKFPEINTPMLDEILEENNQKTKSNSKIKIKQNTSITKKQLTTLKDELQQLLITAQKIQYNLNVEIDKLSTMTKDTYSQTNSYCVSENSTNNDIFEQKENLKSSSLFNESGSFSLSLGGNSNGRRYSTDSDVSIKDDDDEDYCYEEEDDEDDLELEKENIKLYYPPRKRKKLLSDSDKLEFKNNVNNNNFNHPDSSDNDSPVLRITRRKGIYKSSLQSSDSINIEPLGSNDSLPSNDLDTSNDLNSNSTLIRLPLSSSIEIKTEKNSKKKSPIKHRNKTNESRKNTKRKKNQPRSYRKKKKKKNEDELNTVNNIDPIDAYDEERNVLTPNDFWIAVDPYIVPLTEADYLFLIPKSINNDSCFTIPPLGKHYTLQWKEEDQEYEKSINNPENNNGNNSLFSDSDNSNLNKSDNNQIENKQQQQQPKCGDLTQRLLSSFLEQNVINKSNSSTKPKTSNTSDLPISDSPIVQYNYKEMLNLEERIKFELQSIGLYSLTDQNVSNEDDEICAEIRSLQAQLASQIKANNAFKQEFLYKSLTKSKQYEESKSYWSQRYLIEELYLQNSKSKKSKKKSGRSRD